MAIHATTSPIMSTESVCSADAGVCRYLPAHPLSIPAPARVQREGFGMQDISPAFVILQSAKGLTNQCSITSRPFIGPAVSPKPSGYFRLVTEAPDSLLGERI